MSIICCSLFTQESNSPKLFPKQKEGSIAPGAKLGDYQQINAGAVKIIYKKIVQDSESGKLTLDPARVLYVAGSCLGRIELNEEVATAQDIEAALKRISSDSSELHVQTDFQIREDGLGVDAPAAIGDLEDCIRDESLSLEMRLDLAYQVIVGMHNMQKAGYVTGDPKPENILVFKTSDGRLIARISDFGKARKLGKDDFGIDIGNPRFAAPEGVLSYQGEVFSTALMVLRILEEGLHPQKCKRLQVNINDKVRRGVEGLLLRKGRSDKVGVLDRAAITCDFVSAKLCGSSLADRAQREERTIHHHIRRVSHHHFRGNSAQPIDKALIDIFGLLKQMTRADPKDRPSMEEVEKRYKGIMDKDKIAPIPSKTDPFKDEQVEICGKIMSLLSCSQLKLSAG